MKWNLVISRSGVFKVFFDCILYHAKKQLYKIDIYFLQSLAPLTSQDREQSTSFMRQIFQGSLANSVRD